MKTLYLGLNRLTAKKYNAFFSPIIRIIPKSKNSPSMKYAVRYVWNAKTILLTSPTSVSLFFAHMLRAVSKHDLKKKHFICIGNTTAHRILTFLPKAFVSIASVETSEGLVSLLSSLPQQETILYPHSELSRPIIKNFLLSTAKEFFAYSHYYPIPRTIPRTLFQTSSDIILTSPSIVKAYASQFPILPNKRHWCQGPISSTTFQQIYKESPILLASKI